MWHRIDEMFDWWAESERVIVSLCRWFLVWDRLPLAPKRTQSNSIVITIIRRIYNDVFTQHKIPHIQPTDVRACILQCVMFIELPLVCYNTTYFQLLFSCIWRFLFAMLSLLLLLFGIFSKILTICDVCTEYLRLRLPEQSISTQCTSEQLILLLLLVLLMRAYGKALMFIKVARRLASLRCQFILFTCFLPIFF